jgi:hypothetical protein
MSIGASILAPSALGGDYIWAFLRISIHVISALVKTAPNQHHSYSMATYTRLIHQIAPQPHPTYYIVSIHTQLYYIDRH